MPFERVGNKFVSPSGKEFSKKQVQMYYSDGQSVKKPKERSHKKKAKPSRYSTNDSETDRPS